MADIEVSGLRELRETLLKKLPEALQGKASQMALAAAARPIVNQAKALAPTRKPRGFMGPTQGESLQGNLRRSIYSYRFKGSTKTREVRHVGVRARAFYWRFIEFGRATISKAKGSLGNPRKGWFGKIVRAVPARPFMRPAFEANKERAVGIYARSIQPAIVKVAAQAQRRSLRRIRKAITGF